MERLVAHKTLNRFATGHDSLSRRSDEMEAIALMDYLKANRLEREIVIKSRIALKTMRFLKISSLLVTGSYP
jgi:hypothetical protein